MITKINSFINTENKRNFSETFKIRNVFYWVGLPFLAIGITGLIGWPSSIIKLIKDGQASRTNSSRKRP